MKVWLLTEHTVDDTTVEVWATEEAANRAAEEAVRRLNRPGTVLFLGAVEDGVWEGENNGNPWRVEVTETEVQK